MKSIIVIGILLFFNINCISQLYKDSFLTYNQRTELRDNIRFYEIATVSRVNFSEFGLYSSFLLDTSWHLVYEITPVNIKLNTDTLKLYSIYKKNLEFTNGRSFILQPNFGSYLNHYYLIGVGKHEIYYLSGGFCKNFQIEYLKDLCISISDFYQLKYWNYQLTNIKVKKKRKGYKVSGFSMILNKEFTIIDKI